MTDSSTGGYLVPTSAPPVEGRAFEDLFHDVVTGVTGLANALVRPRLQPEPPDAPAFGVNWASFGITRIAPERGTAYVTHHPDGAGYDELRRHEVVEILCTFYGDAADDYAALLRDGLWIPQNREAMQLAGVGLIDVTDPVNLTELIKERYWRRIDETVILRRERARTYAVLNLVSAAGSVQADRAATTFDTQRVR